MEQQRGPQTPKPDAKLQKPDNIDVVIWAAQSAAQYLDHLAGALVAYKTTGRLPDDVVAAAAAANLTKKRRRTKQPKLNKDGTEKQPRKPTAYNAWMQAKLKELKAAAEYDPEQKHVDTFKQAAQIWAAMSDAEKKKYTEDFKANNGVVVEHVSDEAPATDEDVNRVAVSSADSSSSEESSSSDEGEAPAPAPTPTHKPAPKPAPKPEPAPAPAPAAAEPPKKKKKRKQEAAAPQSVAVASPPEGEKKKKKKHKKHGASAE